MPASNSIKANYPIGVSVALQNDYTIPGADEPIIFDTILLDDGSGAYDTVTGLYTTLSGGLYQISAGLAITSGGTEVSIAINGDVEVYIIGAPTTQVGASLTVYLAKGDTVGLYSLSSGVTFPGFTGGGYNNSASIIKIG